MFSHCHNIYYSFISSFELTYDLLGLEDGARLAGERNFERLHRDDFHDRIVCINAGHVICKLNVQAKTRVTDLNYSDL